MSEEQRPPTIDPVAAAHWGQAAPAASPWLHEEVGRRMEERLQWIMKTPKSWCDWGAVRGGLQVHQQLAKRFAGSPSFDVEPNAAFQKVAQEALGKPWWNMSRWTSSGVQFSVPPEGTVDMLWANMALHLAAEPQQLIQQWHRALAVDGYLMFSCLGPDTVRELHAVYAEMGWGPAGHDLTDMHDWGDMLVHAGFAEPVMDMERITLSFATPARLIAELQELGCNLHPQRFQGLRGRAWRARLEQALSDRLRTDGPESPLTLTFEIVYGHAFKPKPRIKVSESSAVSLQDMRAMLQTGRA